MFPERPKVEERADAFVIYPGFKAFCAVQLTVDRCWRYILATGEKLTVQIRDKCDNVVISREFTRADVDDEDKTVRIVFTEEETNQLTVGEKYYFTAFKNGFVVVPAELIKVRKVVDKNVV